MRASLRKQLSILVQKRLHVERRGGKRIVPVRRTLCLIQSSKEERTTATVQNLSRSGIAVQSDVNFAPGTLLRLLLVNDAHTYSLALEMSVVRSSRAGEYFLIAGPFTRPLMHEEIVPFVL